MTLNLSPAEADTRLRQIDEAMIDVRRLASKILDTTETMTAGSWLGGRAQVFRSIMNQHHDDFNTVITALQQVADKGKNDIHTLVAHESS